MGGGGEDKEVVFWAYNTGERCSGVKSVFAPTTASPQRLSLMDPSRVMRMQPATELHNV